MYSLKDILRDYFDELDAAGKLKSNTETDAETRFLNFYSDKVKNFNEILHALDIEDSMEILKERTSKNYVFSERNKKFIIMIFDEYANKLDTIRRGQIYEANSDLIVSVYEGFIDIFKDATASADLLGEVSMQMINRLDVPTRKLQSIRESSYKRFEKMVNDKMLEFEYGMNTMERYQWLLGLEVDMNAFITKWSDLFDMMNELRTEEIIALAEEEVRNMSDTENTEAQIDFAFCEEFSSAIDADEEYQSLQRKRCKMLGVEYEEPRQKPITIHDILNVNQKVEVQKKRPFVKKVEKQFYDVNVKLQQRYTEIRTAVIRKHISDYEPPVDEDEEDIDFSSLISTEELLQTAIEELKKDWKLDRKKSRGFRWSFPT